MTLARSLGSTSSQPSMVSVHGSMIRADRGLVVTVGGVAGDPSERYFLAVRQSQPASRAMSTQVAPAARSAP